MGEIMGSKCFEAFYLKKLKSGFPSPSWRRRWAVPHCSPPQTATDAPNGRWISTRRGDNTDLRLRRPLPADSRRQLAQSVPGVTRAEAQGSEEGLAHG